MAFVLHSPHKVGCLLRTLDQDEERCNPAVACEHVQDARSGLRMRPIVEGKGHDRVRGTGSSHGTDR